MFRKRSKLFCIGYGKTGTSSLERALSDLGYKMGDQATGELLIFDWAQRDFEKIIAFCKKSDAFQDSPFCLPYTYIPLDQAFRGSKFILTVRSSTEEWYSSLMRFHSKVFADGERVPSTDDYKKSEYRFKGYSWEARILMFDITEDNPNDKEVLTVAYERHNESVIEYFRHRSNDLLVLNVAHHDAYEKLCAFLNKAPLYDKFPWENKT